MSLLRKGYSFPGLTRHQLGQVERAALFAALALDPDDVIYIDDNPWIRPPQLINPGGVLDVIGGAGINPGASGQFDTLPWRIVVVRVTDGTTGLALPGATVTIHCDDEFSHTDLTNAGGFCAFVMRHNTRTANTAPVYVDVRKSGPGPAYVPAFFRAAKISGSFGAAMPGLTAAENAYVANYDQVYRDRLFDVVTPSAPKERYLGITSLTRFDALVKVPVGGFPPP